MDNQVITVRYGAELDRYYYDGELGAIYSKDLTEFRLWSPPAQSVRLCLYTTGSDSEPGAHLINTYDMQKSDCGVFSVTVQGDLHGVYYTYFITHSDGSIVETADIYARAVGVNGDRGMVADLTRTDPDGWDKDSHVLLDKPTDAVVWEVMIRDFSADESSGVSENNCGKFLAFCEDTTLYCKPDGISTCVGYLKELGVNCVQLNPFYDFASVDESKPLDNQYNWGYDPKNYNAPEGSFSSDPYDGSVRIRECKQMIGALHSAGISVIMDVVYNHTYCRSDSWHNCSVPGYYYRISPDGEWSDGSYCGNDTASEHKMFSKYMLDSVLYWTQQYHIDGFRFDIMGLHDIQTMKRIRAELDRIDPRILMYGEAWQMPTKAADGVLLANQDNMHQMPHTVGAFCDGIRNAVKGGEFDRYSKGFVQSGANRQAVIRGICAETDGMLRSPSQAVNYVSCHDGCTLYDKLCLSLFGEKADFARHEDILAMNRLAAAIVLTSQGMPFMQAGEEFARTKSGEHNSYKSPVAVNRIDWNNLTVFGDLTEYYRGLIKLRQSVCAMRDSTTDTITNHIRFFDIGDKAVAYSLRNNTPCEWQNLILMFNGGDTDIDVALEQFGLCDAYTAVVDSVNAGVGRLFECSGSVMLPGTSALILVDSKSFSDCQQ